MEERKQDGLIPFEIEAFEVLEEARQLTAATQEDLDGLSDDYDEEDIREFELLGGDIPVDFPENNPELPVAYGENISEEHVARRSATNYSLPIPANALPEVSVDQVRGSKQEPTVIQDSNPKFIAWQQTQRMLQMGLAAFRPNPDLDIQSTHSAPPCQVDRSTELISQLQRPRSFSDSETPKQSPPQSQRPGKRSSKSPVKSSTAKKPPRKKGAKENGRPQRPLSAYNIFFKFERSRLLGQPTPRVIDDNFCENTSYSTKKENRLNPHHKYTFREMAEIIGARWRNLSDKDRQPFLIQAAAEKRKQQVALKAWEASKKAAAVSAAQSARGDSSGANESGSTNVEASEIEDVV